MKNPLSVVFQKEIQMPKVTFITPDGEEKTLDCPDNTDLMSTAVDNQVEGIPGDCGGVASCATCHVHVDPEWIGKVGPATEMEKDVLEFEDNTTECSRLGCQVFMTPELDGLIVKVVEQ